MTNGNDAAFRTDGFVSEGGEFMNPAPGLTKREYFAVMAMQGMLANGEYSMSFDGEAKNAVFCADALIEALNKPLTSAKDAGDDVE